MAPIVPPCTMCPICRPWPAHNPGPGCSSASARNATAAMLEGVQKNAGAQTLVDIPGFLVLGGGVPVRVGNEVIGAVGVAGAPGGHLDEQCANAALAKVADLLK